MDQGDESTGGRHPSEDGRPLPEKGDSGRVWPTRGLRGLFRRAPALPVQHPATGSSPPSMAMQGAGERRNGAPAGTQQTQSTMPVSIQMPSQKSAAALGQNAQSSAHQAAGWNAVRRSHWAPSPAELARRHALLAEPDADEATETAGDVLADAGLSPMVPGGQAFLSAEFPTQAPEVPTAQATHEMPPEMGSLGASATRTSARSIPTIRLPDGRSMATATAAVFLAHQAYAVWQRHARSRLAPAVHTPYVLSTPLLVDGDPPGRGPTPGTRGWLLAALSGRMRGDEGDKIVPLLTQWAMSTEGEDRAGLDTTLCWVDEGEQRLTVAVRLPHGDEATHEQATVSREPWPRDYDEVRVLATRIPQGFGGLGAAWPGQSGRLVDIARVGVPVRGAAPPEVAANGGEEPVSHGRDAAYAWTPAEALHPAPLLVPLGAVGENHVWHVNLATLGNLLVAAGAFGGAQGLVLTLLAHIAAQAHPSQVEFLVVAEPGTAFTALASLPHLCAPMINPFDIDALAAALDLAEDRVLARRVWRQEMGGAGARVAHTPNEKGAVIPPRLLVVIDRMEDVAQDWTLAVRLRALGEAGPRDGVSLLATADEVAALGPLPLAHVPLSRADQGSFSIAPSPAELLLSVFRGRVTYGLDNAEDSQMLLGRSGAEALQGSDLLVVVGQDDDKELATGDGSGAIQPRPFVPLAPPARLQALALSESAAHDVIAAVIATGRPRPSFSSRSTMAPQASTADVGVPTVRQGNGDNVVLPSMAAAHDVESVVPADSATRSVDGDTHDLAMETALPETAADHVVASDRPAADQVVTMDLLGERRVEVAGRSLLEGASTGAPAPLSPMALSLLIYLVLQRGKAVSGEVIAADLWPESRASGKSFHKTLGRLRDGLGGALGLPGRHVIRQQGGSYTLDPALIRVDAFDVERLLAEADAADEATRARLWWQVVDLYRDDLLGADPPDWALDTRRRLHDAFVRMLRLLWRWEETRGNLRAALAAAERLVEVEPDDETAHRLVMRLHAKQGDLTAALQHYDRLVATLHADVGTDVDPEADTQALYRRIAAHAARVAQATEAALDEVWE